MIPFFVLVAVVLFLIYDRLKFRHWSLKGVPHEAPVPFFGHYFPVTIGKRPPGEFYDFYYQWVYILELSSRLSICWARKSSKSRFYRAFQRQNQMVVMTTNFMFERLYKTRICWVPLQRVGILSGFVCCEMKCFETKSVGKLRPLSRRLSWKQALRDSLHLSVNNTHRVWLDHNTGRTLLVFGNF